MEKSIRICRKCHEHKDIASFPMSNAWTRSTVCLVCLSTEAKNLRARLCRLCQREQPLHSFHLLNKVHLWREHVCNRCRYQKRKIHVDGSVRIHPDPEVRVCKICHNSLSLSCFPKINKVRLWRSHSATVVYGKEGGIVLSDNIFKRSILSKVVCKSR